MPADQGATVTFGLYRSGLAETTKKALQALPVETQNKTPHFSSSLSLFQVTYRHVIKTWPIKSLFCILLIQCNQVTKDDPKPGTWP